MFDLLWPIPERRLNAAGARRAILLQHDRIRDLLETAHDVAEHALDGEGCSPDAVANAIGDIHAMLEAHLTFEERVLVAILEDDLPLGPVRAQHLKEDHEKQRGTLAGLHREALRGPQLPTLAVKLAFLTTWLLADMQDEESNLLTPEVVRDDVVVIDQSSG
jgi:Hemerythrin HHE cation binding domain